MHPATGRRTDFPRQISGTARSSLICSRIAPFLCLLVVLYSAPAAPAEQAFPGKPSDEGTAASSPAQEQTPLSPRSEETPVLQEGGKTEPPSTQNKEAPEITAPPANTVEKPQDGEAGIVDIFHKGISRGVLATASWLDSFFYDPRYAAEENQTRMILRLDAFNEKAVHTDYNTHVQFRIRLPQMKNKAHLIISGDPEDEGEEIPSGTAVAPVRTDVNKDIAQTRQTSTSLGYFFKSDERRNVNARVGMRYRHGDIVVFLRSHFRILYKLDGWSLRFTQEFPWWSDTKWESYTAIDLERQFQNEFFFRTSAIGHWYDDHHGYQYTLSASLVQPLSPRRALSYEWANHFVTRPTNKLTEVVLAVRYRQRLWKDWLYAEIAPQLRYPRDHDFKHLAGIWYRLEMQFGWPFLK